MTFGIDIVKDAYVQPSPSFPSKPLNAGVFDSDGNVIVKALHVGPSSSQNKPIYKEMESEYIDSAIFGGFLFTPHFGHIITESLGRLWAIDSIDKTIEKIVFFPGFSHLKIPSYFHELMVKLGVDKRVLLVENAMQVGRLFVPDQLFGLGPLIGAHPKFIEFSKGLISSARLGVSPGKKIYVSRSNYKVERGGVVCEPILEENLKRAGYEIVFPEKMSITEQIEVYMSAEILLFSEGSALHFYGLMAQPSQKVGILVTRHNGWVFKKQVQAFSGVEPVTIKCHKKYLIPKQHDWPMANSGTLLDYSMLKKELVEAGFISADLMLREPSASEINEHQRIFEASHKAGAAWSDELKALS